MDFKPNDIVIVCYSNRLGRVVTGTRSKYVGIWVNIHGNEVAYCFDKAELKPATDREKFLYHLFGLPQWI